MFSKVLVVILFFVFSTAHAASQCKKSFIKQNPMKPAGNSDFTSFIPGTPGSYEGFITTVNSVPLTTKNLLKAYSNGAFPWNPETNGTVSWYAPKWHGVIYLNKLFGRSTAEELAAGNSKRNPRYYLKKNSTTYLAPGEKTKHLRAAWNQAKKKGWSVTFNTAFDQVVKECAEHTRPNYNHVWLVGEVQKAFSRLFDEGHAYSVEVWDAEGNLIGGTYGIYQGRVFSAESMFHKENNAGKVAVLALSERLNETGHEIVDAQTVNNNTRSNYYAKGVTRYKYLDLIREEESRGEEFNTTIEELFPSGVWHIGKD